MVLVRVAARSLRALFNARLCCNTAEPSITRSDISKRTANHLVVSEIRSQRSRRWLVRALAFSSPLLSSPGDKDDLVAWRRAGGQSLIDPGIRSVRRLCGSTAVLDRDNVVALEVSAAGGRPIAATRRVKGGAAAVKLDLRTHHDRAAPDATVGAGAGDQ